MSVRQDQPSVGIRRLADQKRLAKWRPGFAAHLRASAGWRNCRRYGLRK